MHKPLDCTRDTGFLLGAEDPESDPCSEEHVAFVKPLAVDWSLGTSLPGYKFYTYHLFDYVLGQVTWVSSGPQSSHL